jgi:hypothetical protein
VNCDAVVSLSATGCFFRIDFRDDSGVSAWRYRRASEELEVVFVRCASREIRRSDGV